MSVDTFPPATPDGAADSDDGAVLADGYVAAFVDDAAFIDDEPPPPEWVFEAQREGLVADLTAAAHRSLHAQGDALVTTALSGLQALQALDPDEVATGGDRDALLNGILATQRLINHLQAAQQRWLAAFARPGVAADLDSLVEGCQGPNSQLAKPYLTPDELPPDLPVDESGNAQLSALLDRPVWKPALDAGAARLAAVELGAMLRLAPVTAQRRTEDAVHMVDDLAPVLAAQESGDLDGYRASIISSESVILSKDQQATVAESVLPVAADLTPGRLRNLVRRKAIAIDPAAARRRQEQAKANRGVRVEPSEDDMAQFKAFVDASDAQLAYGVLNQVSTALTAAGLADGRGSSQLRADVFTDIFHTLATTGSACIDVPADGSVTHDRAAAGPEARGPRTGAITSRPCRATGATRDVTDTGSTNSAAAADSGTFTAADSGTDTTEHHSGRPRPGPSSRRRRSRTGRSICLNVYVHASTLAGVDDEPAELDGYGVISADTARALAESADTVRALVRPTSPTACGHDGPWPAPDPEISRSEPDGPPPDPDNGTTSRNYSPSWNGVHAAPENARASVCPSPLNAGRATYRPPTAVSDFVTARDRHCQFPGCRASASRCDIDHRAPYQAGGATCPCNLDLLCRFHHQIKTFTPWSAVPNPHTGRLIWTSPSGRKYATEAAHPMADDPPPF